MFLMPVTASFTPPVPEVVSILKLDSPARLRLPAIPSVPIEAPPGASAPPLRIETAPPAVPVPVNTPPLIVIGPLPVAEPAVLAKTSVPLFMVVPPANVFAPASVKVPLPVLYKASGPPEFWITPANVLDPPLDPMVSVFPPLPLKLSTVPAPVSVSVDTLKLPRSSVPLTVAAVPLGSAAEDPSCKTPLLMVVPPL